MAEARRSRDNFVDGVIERHEKGKTDPQTGEWIEGGVSVICAGKIDIQPKSGGQRATSLDTRYESEYVGFMFFGDCVFANDAVEIEQGDVLRVGDRKYRIVFKSVWAFNRSGHYELDLREEN